MENFKDFVIRRKQEKVSQRVNPKKSYSVYCYTQPTPQEPLHYTATPQEPLQEKKLYKIITERKKGHPIYINNMLMRELLPITNKHCTCEMTPGQYKEFNLKGVIWDKEHKKCFTRTMNTNTNTLLKAFLYDFAYYCYDTFGTRIETEPTPKIINSPLGLENYFDVFFEAVSIAELDICSQERIAQANKSPYFDNLPKKVIQKQAVYYWQGVKHTATYNEINYGNYEPTDRPYYKEHQKTDSTVLRNKAVGWQTPQKTYQNDGVFKYTKENELLQQAWEGFLIGLDDATRDEFLEIGFLNCPQCHKPIALTNQCPYCNKTFTDEEQQAILKGMTEIF